MAPNTRRSSWTLRRRLLVSIVALLAVVSVIIGTVSVIALQASLLSKVDTQVSSAVERAQNFVDGFPGDNGNGPTNGPGRPDGILGGGGFTPGTVAVTVESGTTSGAVFGQNLDSTTLTADQTAAILAVESGGEPTTVDLGGDLGQYRVALGQDGNGNTIAIGLPLAEVNSTLTQVLIVIGIVTLLGLVAAFVAGTAIVRVALRPLDRVAATASHVAELPLERGEVALAVRVPWMEVQMLRAAI